MRRFLIVLAAAMTVLCSCSNYKDIAVEDIDISGVEFVSMSRYRIALVVEVDNPSGLTFKVEDIEGAVFKNGGKFADITVDNQLVIPSRSLTEVPVECTVAVADPLSVLAMGLNFKNLDFKQFTLDIEGTVKWGNIKKKVAFKNLPLESLYANYVGGGN